MAPYHRAIIPLKPITYTFGINLQPNQTTNCCSCTSNMGIMTENTWQLYGCTKVSRWSYYNMKKKSNHQFCKRIRLHRKIPDWATKQCRGNDQISHEKLPPIPEKSAFMFHHTFTENLGETSKMQKYQKKKHDKTYKYWNKTTMI